MGRVARRCIDGACRRAPRIELSAKDDMNVIYRSINQINQAFLVLPVRIELTTSPLPRGCSTTELRQQYQ
jgi:hypothetical protein